MSNARFKRPDVPIIDPQKALREKAQLAADLEGARGQMARQILFELVKDYGKHAVTAFDGALENENPDAAQALAEDLATEDDELTRVELRALARLAYVAVEEFMLEAECRKPVMLLLDAQHALNEESVLLLEAEEQIDADRDELQTARARLQLWQILLPDARFSFWLLACSKDEALIFARAALDERAKYLDGPRPHDDEIRIERMDDEHVVSLDDGGMVKVLDLCAARQKIVARHEHPAPAVVRWLAGKDTTKSEKLVETLDKVTS